MAAAALAATLGCVAVAVGWSSWQALLRQVHAPLIDAPERIEILPGDTARSLGQRLMRGGHLDVPDWAWRLYLSGRERNDIQRGEYALHAGTSAADLLDAAVRGDVMRYRLTLVEGSTFRDLRELLARAPRLRQQAAELTDTELMARLGMPGIHPEGRFFPDTYSYTAADADLDILRRAARRLDEVLAAAWAQRDPELPLADPQEALVLASIVEKETGRAADRARVAGVFVRRLQRGMRLQTDPTIIYGLGEQFDGNLTRAHLRTDAPYNTYTRHGLPPTPICMPSLASIEAAVQPADGTALYFVARGDGTSEFSDTLAEHQRAVRRYQLARQ